jgi:hypothetical protein
MAKKNRMTIHFRDQFAVLDMGDIEIWDGADLALLRETLIHLIEREERKFVGVDMRYVKYVPSGFFGMLYDWHEKGVAVRLYAPQPRVKNMLWFRQFFDRVEEETFTLLSNPKHQMLPAKPTGWKSDIPWAAEQPRRTQPATSRQ